MNNDKENIVNLLRELVAAIYKDCMGAYGADCYEGQYEEEIQKFVEGLLHPNLADSKGSE